jgi:hypothetical protein
MGIMGLNRDTRRLFGGIVLLAVFLAYLRQPELTGDPGIYRNRMALLFDGQIPYIDFFFEHFPLAILPMALAWLLGGAFDLLIYTGLFALMMAACLGVTLILIERTGDRLSITDPGLRWLAMAGPLFPVVLFRSDPFPVLLAMAGFYAMVFAKERMAIGMEVAGILTKGWPVVLAIPEWWRGRRRRAAVLVVTAVAIGGLLITLPGFSQAREFSGIHSETPVGAVYTLSRISSGADLGLINDAGATYVSVPVWAAVSNLSLGLVLLILALARIRGEFSWEGAVRLLSAAVMALLIGSPLLSAQFILWPTPFLALHPDKTVRGMAIAVSALTLIYMLAWNPGFEGDLWWVGVVNLRNIILVILGATTAWAVAGKPATAQTTSSG